MKILIIIIIVQSRTIQVNKLQEKDKTKWLNEVFTNAALSNRAFSCVAG